MSKTVWLKEINNHLIQRIREKVELENKDVTTVFAYPESLSEEISLETLNLPKIVVTDYDILPDYPALSLNYGLYEEVGGDDNEVIIKEYPKPYWVYYRFTVMAEYYEDLFDVLEQLFITFPERTYLQVPDKSGTPVELFMERVEAPRPSNTEGMPDKTNNEIRQRRVLLREMKYKIASEIEDGEERTYRRVQSHNVDTD